MNINEIKEIEAAEPTQYQLDRRVIALAEEQQDPNRNGTTDFYWFLVGWMTTDHHEEMALVARRWLETHYPKQLKELDA